MKMRSHCPINFALEHFGDKWSLLIIRDLMFKGKRHYNEFSESGEKVSTSVLGDRLRQLEESRIITKGQDTGVGAILFNDKNGYHSQSGAYLTYAHHLMFSRNTIDLNMLSFGLSAGMIQYKLDTTAFLEYDPLLLDVESAVDFNIDLGFSYHFINSYVHLTIKNLLPNDGININEQGLKFDNLRTYLFSLGNVFSKYGSDWSHEPSLMVAFKDTTKEAFIDVNFKSYLDLDFGKLFAGA